MNQRQLDSNFYLDHLFIKDFYRYQTKAQGHDVLNEYGGFDKRYSKRNNNPVNQKRWSEGRTGIPIVDASMIELNKTGFTSNKCR